MKNTGTPSQKQFEAHIKALGKRAFLHRFDDAKDVRGRTGVAGYIKEQPADYLLVLNGVTSFAEVKSTQDPTAFRFRQIEPSQRAAAKQVTAAGGNYGFVIHRIEKDEWYALHWNAIARAEAADVHSMKWEEMIQIDWSEASGL